jgi:putative ABC transport system permease protein
MPACIGVSKPGGDMFDRIADVWREAAYGFRLLVKNPTHTLIVSATLALGIGATTAIFSVLYATVLAPLPYANADRLVWIEQRNAEGRGRGLSTDRLDAWRRDSRMLDDVALSLLGFANFTISGANGAERIRLEQVDFHTLDVLGIKPVLGRSFQKDDELVVTNSSRALIISYGLWQRVFGGDPGVLGKKMPGWTAPYADTIIGVMPKGFYIHPDRSNADGWYVNSPSASFAIARLKPGVTPQQAQAELANLGREENPPNAASNVQNTFTIKVTSLHSFFRDGYARTVYLLLGAVMFVLLIGSVNVANLQLNRNVGRQPEIAARIALGAGRWRLLRQLVIENVVLTLVGGVLGLLVSVAGIYVFVAVAPNFYQPAEEIRVNGPALLFTLIVCMLTGILSGLIPGFRGSRLDLSAALKEGGRGVVGRARLGLRRTLVVSEIALALVLLIGAGLMINSYARLTNVDVGLDAENVVSMEVNLFGMDRYRTLRTTSHWIAKPEISNFYTSALERIVSLPGVESAAVTSNLPPRNGLLLPFNILGKPETAGPDRPRAAFHEVSPRYFETMKIPVQRGRPFTDLDNETAPAVVIVSETFVRQFFGNEDPIGQSVQVYMHSRNSPLQADRVREIVGVVRDIRMGFRSEFMPILYIPYRQNITDYENNGQMSVHAMQTFVVRTSGNPMRLVPLARKAFAEVDPAVVVTDIMPVKERLDALAGPQKFWMRLLGIFAGLGMFLAAIGVYGVISYSVEQRVHEFGIRTTFGARQFDILRLVLREGLIVLAFGLPIGIAGAYGATRFLANQLYGVSAMDPVTIVAVAIVLTVVAFFACYVPGRRATKLDPLIALRMR